MTSPAYTAALLVLLSTTAFAATPASPPPPTAATTVETAAPASPPADPVPASVPASAMSATNPQNTLAQFVTHPDYQAAIIATARSQLDRVPNACKKAVFRATGETTVLSPIRFSDGKPYLGAWSEKIAASGCGPLQTLNVLTVARAEGPQSHVAMMPGDTHTDPLMQKTALQYAQAVAIRAAPRSCKEQAFIDTRFDGYTGLPNAEVRDGRDGRAWEETWTVSACGTLYDIHLLFTPNATGTELRGSNPIKRS